MSKPMSTSELKHHASDASQCLSDYLTSLVSGTEEQQRQASLLSFWIKDYIRFLETESSFDPKKLIRYKRGSIVKVHLGYRVGSEEGGLHYGIVLDTANALSDTTITIVPLTSLKPGVDVNNLHRSKIYLGDEVYRALEDKLTRSISRIRDALLQQTIAVSEIEQRRPSLDSSEYPIWESEMNSALEQFRNRMPEYNSKLSNLEKVQKTLNSMKVGSIALVGQITTVSKIRVYDPMYPSDVFSNIRLSPESLDKIDAKLKELYTYQPSNASKKC